MERIQMHGTHSYHNSEFAQSRNPGNRVAVEGGKDWNGVLEIFFLRLAADSGGFLRLMRILRGLSAKAWGQKDGEGEGNSKFQHTTSRQFPSSQISSIKHRWNAFLPGAFLVSVGYRGFPWAVWLQEGMAKSWWQNDTEGERVAYSVFRAVRSGWRG
jgi:hypothetical protein